MNYLLPIWILLPLLAFLVSLVVSSKNESLLSKIAFVSVGIQLNLIFIYTVAWIMLGAKTINIKELSVYKTTGYEYFLDLHFDRITAVYLLVGAILTFLITVYSRYYLHRERGYKRFFNTILFFYLGYNITILSGNLETLFIGWEVLGISSFLLIGFYRERYLPVKNAFKIFSIYRLGDLGIILGMWLCHHAWHENVTFLQINAEDAHAHISSSVAIVISLLFILSAVVKSAQFPLSTWLPRAMEGPTPSSAIFYGSLSVHLGVFLLLRTFPFWENQVLIRIFVVLIGLTSSILATFSARVQSSIKAQIAYASIAQIGIMFIEVALGLELIALIHFAGNAFLRTYQLLTSPSAVTYLIREQFYHYTPLKKSMHSSITNKVQNSLYILSLKEWNLDFLLLQYVWNPIKKAGNPLLFLHFKNSAWFFIPLYFIGIILFLNEEYLSIHITHILPYLYALIGFILVLRSFVERKNAYWAWFLVILNHGWTALAISFNEHFTFDHTLMYLSGVFISGILGFICLKILQNKVKKVDLERFYGYSYVYPNLAFAFLLACIGLAGFPITPTFIGEDLIFSHIHENQWGLVIIASLSFFLDGLALIRIFTRLFLGPHDQTFHEVAHKSS